MKQQLPYLLTEDKEEIEIIVNNIMETASKDLVYTKINPPTNQERGKKNLFT